MSKLITSSGVILNREKPRVGVISANSQLLQEWIFDEIDQGIDLTYETAFKEEYDTAIESGQTDDEAWKSANDATEFWDCDSRTVLFGDAWAYDEKHGKYYIDKLKGEYAAVYNNDSNIICVEYSKNIRQCNNTSPCYVMSDGSGPCGDLGAPGDAVIAFDLPKAFYKEDIYE